MRRVRLLQSGTGWFAMDAHQVVNLRRPFLECHARRLPGVLRIAGTSPRASDTRAAGCKCIAPRAHHERRNQRVAELPPTLRLDRPSRLVLRRRLQIVGVVLDSFFVSGLVALSVLSSYEEN